MLRLRAFTAQCGRKRSMSFDATVYVVLGFGILVLLAWILVVIRGSNGTTGGLAPSLGGRFDALERNNETLRRDFNQMDQALRSEIAKGARDGLVAAFDKVKEGTKAQAEGAQLDQMDQALRSEIAK